MNRNEMIEYMESIRTPENEEAVSSIINTLRHTKYGLVFEEKIEDIERDLKNVPTLIEKDKVIAAPDDENCNFLIEGDNLLALKTLQLTHRGKVDVIYIDPPYNTGNKDFKYNDKFSDSKNGYNQSKWLSFMKKRLMLAESLLSDNGIIFISVDDHEYAEAKLLCDKIFSTSSCNNHLNTFHWVSNLKGRQLDGHGAAGTTEYIICYAKNRDNAPAFREQRDYLNSIMPDLYKVDYPVKKDEKGYFQIKNELYNTNSMFNEETRKNLVYDIYYNPTTKSVKTTDVSDENIYADKGYEKISPHLNADGVHKYHAFRWSRTKVENEYDDLYFTNDSGIWKVYTKVRDTSMAIKDLIMNMGSGTAELKKINLKKSFNNPKPIGLIQLLLRATQNKNAVVLDFFAGSGTTGQAVLEQNLKDDGHRHFILCTNNENSICEEVTYQRLKTVITGKRADGSTYSDGISSNLKYMKVDMADKEAVYEFL